ncbi:MAG: hypothetical protein ACD_3C00079G0003 [uncultured bacterium (gcode 4)]|uniref:Uncharacterized protein n=1 Tax=uncultured bacterium (gcode 4) TaxID=1234023 RepID=K2G234_9BACT|nr:MAG: hypothetical protein ACD_3C00079G0003 [uncultured bacterium (gcode 4)]
MTIHLHEYNEREYIVRTFVFKDRGHVIRVIKSDNPEAITDKFELERFIQNSVKRGNYIWIKNKMIQLEESLSNRYSRPVDPVIFIMHLYFKEELSVRDISARIELFWVKIPKNTLNNILANVFWWTLRLHNEITKVTEKKNRAKVIPRNTRRTAAIAEAISIIVKGALNNKKWFDYAEFKNCKNLKERVTLLLKIYSLAWNETEAKLYLTNLHKTWKSMDTIAIILTKLFENAFGEIPNAKIIKVRGMDVNRLLKK